MGIKNLTTSQLKAIQLLTIGTPLNQVAQACKVDVSTVWDWRQLPEFKAELESQKREIYELGLGQLRNLVTTATQQLSALLDSSETPPATKLRGIELILATIKPQPRQVDLLEALKVLTENNVIPPEVLEKVSASFETFQNELKNAFDLSAPAN